MADWYPESMDARAAWHQTFIAQLTTALRTKYNITVAQHAAVSADAAWITHWVAMRHEADALRQQLTKYFNDIAGTDPSLDPPAPIVWGFTADPPDEVPPGVEFRARELARQIKGHSSFAEADVELLGIISSGSAPEPEGDVAPVLQVRATIPYKLNVKGQMRGKHQVRIEYQPQGGPWTTVGYFTKLPVEITITPQTPGQPENGQVRAQYIVDNEPYGNYSVNYPVTVS